VVLKYVPREQFVPFHNRTQRWATLNTHRRAGKTVSLVNDLVFGALECDKYKPQLAYIGPTYAQAKRVAWTYLKDYAEPYMSRPPQEAELKVTLHGDRTLYVLGADNSDTLRGMYLDGGVGDEYALFRPSVFPQVIRPTLSDRNGWFVFASTPRGKNLFYDVVKDARNDPSWYNLELRADTSGIINPKELADLRKDMDPEEFAQEYLCSFDSALKGAIYADEVNEVFMSQRIQLDIYDPSLPTNVVYDLGFTDATVGVFWQEAPYSAGKSPVRVVHVEATQGKDIFHHIEKLHSFAGELGSVWLPHDARAKNLQTGRSIVEQFIKEGIRPELVPAHKVRDRIAATRRLFPLIAFDKLATDDLIEALKGYRRVWDDKNLNFSDVPLHDWCSDYADAFGYLCVVAQKKYAKVGSKIKEKPDFEAQGLNYAFHLEGLHEDRVLQLGNRRIM
jgi:phage terminase large subunit